MGDRHPILFQDDMVQAILAGRKTETRRVIRPQPTTLDGHPIVPDPARGPLLARCPYGEPGHTLWVREAWAVVGDATWYRASVAPELRGPPSSRVGPPDRWRPSIHMPPDRSRLVLEVEEVRVERVLDITAAGARAEGCPDEAVDGADQDSVDAMAVWWFHLLWDKINARRGYGLETNPWVWVVRFHLVAP